MFLHYYSDNSPRSNAGSATVYLTKASEIQESPVPMVSGSSSTSDALNTKEATNERPQSTKSATDQGKGMLMFDELTPIVQM